MKILRDYMIKTKMLLGCRKEKKCKEEDFILQKKDEISWLTAKLVSL